MTYSEVYHDGREKLERAGVPEAALDARLLLEHICGTSRNDLLAHGDTLVTEENSQAYEALINRRSQRIPIQQLTGVQYFMGLEFLVDEHVLIPRQDTEILVEEALKNLHDGMRVLDLCTGSGCILISLLHYSNGCRGVGTDISREALRVAEKNACRLLSTGFLDGGGYSGVEGFPDGGGYSGVEGFSDGGSYSGVEGFPDGGSYSGVEGFPDDGGYSGAEGFLDGNGFLGGGVFLNGDDFLVGDDRIASLKFIESDLFENVEGTFDMIVSNPPYIPTSVMETLMPEVRDHEPRIALDGSEDGLTFYRRITQECGKYLTGGGMLFFEIGYDQAMAVSALMEKAGFLEIQVIKDYAGMDRVVFGTLGFDM